MSTATNLASELLTLTVKQVSTHALILLDPYGRIVGWHAGAERLFGYRTDEILGKSVDLLFTPEDLELGLSNWELTTASVSGYSEDDRWQLRKDRGRIWVSGTLTALRDPDGLLLGFAKILRNQTDFKTQLEAAERIGMALQETDQRKNAFISTLAHELRNPLAVLSNATHLLSLLPPAATDIALPVGMIKRQVQFMGHMVDDLLEVTRMATGKMELRKEHVILQDLIQQAIETCKPSIDSRQHQLRELVPELPIGLVADPVRLRQVLINVIENAAKYTPPGGMIWVKATIEGEEAVVRIQDSGVGIAPDAMPHIFELFTQAEFAGRSQGGLGIGLAVVKETIALHGGTVQADSDGIGKGSEFTLRLPMTQQFRSGP